MFCVRHLLFYLSLPVSVWCDVNTATVTATAPNTDDQVAETVVTSPINQIEGKVSLPKAARPVKNWQAESRILVNYGQYIGFVREDGSFVVNDVPPGSYIVEVANKDYVFEPVRVDITSRGKIRGRKLNLLQPSAVNQIQYPLRLTARTPAQYFRKREEWRVTDMLMNPMVLMMIVPFLLLAVVPKLLNVDTKDPEIQKELQQTLQMPKYEMPELSEMMIKIFGGSGGSGPNKKPKSKTPIAAKPKRAT